MPAKPRVLLAAERFAAGNSGIARVARLMARVLAEEARAGILEVEALSLTDAEPPPGLDLPVTVCGGSRLKFVSQMWRAGFRCSHLVFDFLGMCRARGAFPHRPALVWIHGIEVWQDARADRLRAARGAEFLLCNSHYTRTRADRLHAGFARAHVCWLATEEDEPPPTKTAPPGPPSVLIVGRLDAGGGYKGHVELIRCWPQVAAAVPGARLAIAGDGLGRAALQEMAAASACADQIDFKGFVPEKEMANAWGEANVFAMPSRGEGFGLVYIEAMRQGLPVVASVHDAAQEINIDGRTGFNVDLDKAGELPARLIHLLKDPDAGRSMGEAGRAHWQKHFSYSRFRDRFKPLFLQFLGVGTLASSKPHSKASS